MPLGLSYVVLGVVLTIVFFGGFVKGAAGFGYGVAGTAILAALLGASSAIVIMIIPVLTANISLLFELDRSSFRSCIRRFWIYVFSAMIGTLIGMALLDEIPQPSLAFGLGIYVLAYVVVKQDVFEIPLSKTFIDTCFTEGTIAKAGLGLMSGFIFGSSNIGIQTVAYLDNLSLDRSVFVGVLSMILVGVSTLRVGMAWQIGLYSGGSDLLVISLASVVPGLLGVFVGKKIRGRVPERYYEWGVLALLVIIGIRLSYVGTVNLF